LALADRNSELSPCVAHRDLYSPEQNVTVTLQPL